MEKWIAPEWWGVWNLEGLYREHPIGIALLPLLIQKLGYPLAQAPFLANALYQVISLLLVQRLTAFFVSPMEARSAGWLVPLLPIAFVYRIRANHEEAVLMLFLTALWSTEKSRTNTRWIALTALAAVWTFLVKGIFVVPLLLCCAVWLLVVRRRNAGSRRADIGAWVGIGVAAAVTIAAGAGYEYLYRGATGESFLSVYLSRQLGAAASARDGSLSVINKLHNLASYTGRLLWFAFPGSLAAIGAAWIHRKHLIASKERALEGLRLGIGLPALYVLLFSLSDRVAERYIFPACFVLGACGWIVMLRTSTRFRHLAERMDHYQPWTCPAVWLLLIALNLVNGALGTPVIKL